MYLSSNQEASPSYLVGFAYIMGSIRKAQIVAKPQLKANVKTVLVKKKLWVIITLCALPGLWVLVLEPDPRKTVKDGLVKLAGVEVYTAPGMQAHFQLAFD